MTCGRQLGRPLSHCVGSPNSKPPRGGRQGNYRPGDTCYFFPGLVKAAIPFSFPHRHAGNSVQPGTNKRSNADMEFTLSNRQNSISNIIVQATAREAS